MARTKTPFRWLIVVLRVAAGCFAVAATSLYGVSLKQVLEGYYYSGTGSGVISMPIIAGSITITWNIFSLILMLTTRTSHLLFANGDFVILVAATALGIVGYCLTSGNYWYYGYGSSPMVVQVIGAIMLLVTVITEGLLVLFNFLEWRYIRRANKRSSLPPYQTPYQNIIERKVDTGRDDFELDWQSVESLPPVAKKSATVEV